ncbi:MAG TPA: formate C-acetyltransferase/glycerol dehydratase family glycyl radical enzyme [Spirochaetota bacterium]|nr:formate C-acetyltransferase/glycerol dehydratase family glycyl radical enzyme [Spirochaetota bacterium]HPL17028.1 formate C-acetyltransferase/glycerol dehydratase family glycyl radical enzyme [Spirochaetota bacterium]HQF07017.1 formate C-acetyltransferase/glycerol dehydratase family glycyl radical enzyme [Spirochaetota bacterium]HQH95754.1 formate C-acetyltransferase/glycerol dehydratase family glycyl radical enzyme [Spirochaetota bacterium]HQJ71219.1 formate C-acetyltransferase/glycerol deh
MSTQHALSRPPTRSRVDTLRWRIIEAPQEVCVERARYLTEAMKQHWDQHPLTRMSLAFEHILKNISVIIRDDEVIVGCRTSKLKGAPLFPENKSLWIEGDLENFDVRALQRALITGEEKKELAEEMLPFWKGRTVEDRMKELMPADILEDMDKYIFTMMLEITYGIGHFTMAHDRVLARGLRGVIEDAEGTMAALSPADREGEKGLFYDAVIRSCRAVISFARRYADLALAMAEKERDRARAAELMEVARVCGRVPEYPAETLHEAVQSVYFIHLVAQIESGGNSISLGRIDQILFPYYKKDVDANRGSADRARELVAMLFIKTNEIWNVLEEAFIPGGEGTEGKTTQNVTVGGVGPDGRDATNDMSYIALDAYADVRTVQPNFGVRISPDCPAELLNRAVDYDRDGVLMHLFNDEAIIRSLVKAGHSIEDARNYGMVGCLEPNAQGRTFGSTFAVQFNGIKCVELALANGIDNIFGYPSGIETGDPAGFTSFEDVWAAYDGQVRHFIGQMVRGMEVLDRVISETVPSPFASAMVDGCLQKGKDLTAGGAIYNSTGVQFMGFANVVDSLYAVKKAVFEEKRFTMGELAEWLSQDWQDAEEKRVYLRNKIPKYGNDNDEVDAMAVRVVDHYCDILAGYRNFRGGFFWPGIFSVGFHITMGAFTAATPDGRFAGDVLGNGVTPTTGNAMSGPTAIMNSVTKLPITRVYNGANLNMRFQGKKISTANLVSLIRGYFKRGGTQVQFNMVDSAVLRDAQAHPEKHRDLFVRVSGYSAEFTGLSEIAQEEIISRTEFEMRP